MLQPEFEKSTGFEPSSLELNAYMQRMFETDAQRAIEMDIITKRERETAKRVEALEDENAMLKRTIALLVSASKRETAKRDEALEDENARLKQTIALMAWASK